jgi:Protein of unknown function (DUF3276)
VANFQAIAKPALGLPINKYSFTLTKQGETKKARPQSIVEEKPDQERSEVYTNRVKAGKRTYFFDVKSTRGNDYYLTITESKKRQNNDGTVSYEKHKIFLYKEDFAKFQEALLDATDEVKRLMPDYDFDQPSEAPTYYSQGTGTSELSWD